MDVGASLGRACREEPARKVLRFVSAMTKMLAARNGQARNKSFSAIRETR
jgi:hypothetical protein